MAMPIFAVEGGGGASAAGTAGTVSGGSVTSGSGDMVGLLTIASVQPHVDWGAIPSLQLLAGWAAGALGQARAMQRTSFFDSLDECATIEQMGRVFVHQLPSALVDPVGGGRIYGCGGAVRAVVMARGMCVWHNMSLRTEWQRAEKRLICAPWTRPNPPPPPNPLLPVPSSQPPPP